MIRIIYSKPKLKKIILDFYKKYKPNEEPTQLLVDLLSNDEVIIYLNKFKPEETCLTNTGLTTLILEKFPEWTSKCVKKNYVTKDYSDEQKSKAMEILSKGDPLKYCLDVLKKQHVGEEHLLLLTIISGVSTGLRDRKMLMHIMGVGGSGKGKTDCMEKVGQIFSNYEPIISASPKNIFYKAEDETLIDNGILFFPENDIKDIEFQALERVLTDDKDIIPKHETVINQNAKSLEIKQINVMWRNSVGTTDDEDNQLNNRYYIINVDESLEQDEQVYNHILNNWNVNQKNIDEELHICNLITDLIKKDPVKIIIPYIRGIGLTFKDDRRTIKKFLRLVSNITYFYRHQRAKCGDLILSEMKDFNIANLIWDKINRYESSKLPEYETNIIDEISKHKEISVTELAHILKKDISNLNKKIIKMEERGLVYCEKHTITTNIGEDRVTKPKKLLKSTKTPQKRFRFGTSPKIYDLAVHDLQQLNIEELEIPEFRFGSFGTVLKVRDQKQILKFLKIIFKTQKVSHFLKINQNNIYNNNNNNNNNSSSTKEAQIQKIDKQPKRVPKPNQNRTKTEKDITEEKIEIIDVSNEVI